MTLSWYRNASFLRKLIVISLVVSHATIARPQQIDWRFRTECVGRAEFKIPSDGEVAGYSYRRMKDEIRRPGNQQRFQFQDGQEADWAKLEYLGFTYISNPASENQIMELQQYFSAQTKTIREEFLHSLSSSERATSVEDVDTGTKKALAWRVGSEITTLIRSDQNLLLVSLSGQNNFIENKAKLMSLVHNFHGRDIYTVPVGSGLCIPYGFISDDSHEARSVTSSYRFKSHPDITISLNDSSADLYSSNAQVPYKDVKQEINFFWSQFMQPGNAAAVASIWKLPSLHSIDFARKQGTASFVSIKHSNGLIDYGFLAILHDPSKNNTLKLIVLQKSENSLKAGIPPLRQDEFNILAESVAKSVDHRQ